MNGVPFWTIKKILDKNFEDNGDIKEVQVQWEGFTADESSWEPVSVFKDCLALLYKEGVRDGIIDTLGHTSGLLPNEKVYKLLEFIINVEFQVAKFIEKFATANPEIDIKRAFPTMKNTNVNNKNLNELSRAEKQKLRKNLQKMTKSAGRQGFKRSL